MFALCSERCLGVKSLCFVVPLGQSQWAEVMCHCHPGPEGPVHPNKHYFALLLLNEFAIVFAVDEKNDF